MKKYFYGVEVTDREIEKGYISLHTLSKVIKYVYAGKIMNIAYEHDWEVVQAPKFDEEEYEEMLDYFDNILSWYVVSDNAVDLLEEAGETILYNSTLELYFWGLSQIGVHWADIYTDIAI